MTHRQARRLANLEVVCRRPEPTRPRPDLSIFTDEEVDELAAIAQRVQAGEPLGAADEAAIAQIEAAARQRTAGIG